MTVLLKQRLRALSRMLVAVLIFAAGYSLLTRGSPTLAYVGSQQPGVSALDHQWPPIVGQQFPNLVMVSHTGAVGGAGGSSGQGATCRADWHDVPGL